MTIVKALMYRPFALLWGGQTISRLGDSLYRIALAWWVLEKTGSATAAGSVLIVSFTPTVIFLLIGGVAADRFSRRRMMLVSDVLRGLLVMVIAGLATTNRLEVWHLYGFSLIFGVADAFFNPAYSALVPEITPPELLPSANSLFSLGNQIAGIAGPLLGALIVKLGGTGLGFALDGVSFFVAALCILLIGGAAAAPPIAAVKRPGVLHDLRDGFAAVGEQTWIWLTILLTGLSNLLSVGALEVTLPFFVKNDLRADVDTYGLLSAALAAGSILGALWLGSRKLRKRGLWLYLSFMLGVSMFAIVGISRSAWLTFPAMFISGAGVTICGLCWTNALQQYVPREKLGRVYSIDQVGSYMLIPVGYGVAGWATDHLGAASMLVITGILAALIISVGLFSASVRQLD